MTIYNKEGNVYKLKNTNVKPIDNNVWNQAKLHNFDFGSVTLPDENPTVTKFKSDFKIRQMPVEPPPIRESKTVEKPEPVIEPEPIEPDDEPVVEYKDDPTTKFLRDNKILFWCLPISKKLKEDALYGESYYAVEFGKKFRFEGILIDQQDLTMHFWTRNVSIEKNSIVSIIGTREVREGRCWQVYNIQEKSGGLLVESIPSDLSPDFSD